MESGCVKGCSFNIRALSYDVSQAWIGSQLSLSLCHSRLLCPELPLASENQHRSGCNRTTTSRGAEILHSGVCPGEEGSLCLPPPSGAGLGNNILFAEIP